MKGIVLLVLAIALFFLGALYGIEKNQQKETDGVVVELTPSAHDLGEKGDCESYVKEEKVPWISRLAGGIGEGIAVSFNGIVLIFTEVLSP